MKRYKENVFEQENGVTFENSEEAKGGESSIRTINDKGIGKGDYKNPPIPEEFEHKYGNWDDGFIIQNRNTNSQFVWVPVASLKPNGTIDGVSFNEKFGRRNFCNDDFSEMGYHEPMTEEFKLQIQSVKKYGGFYISRYYISTKTTWKELPKSVYTVEFPFQKYYSENINNVHNDAKKVNDKRDVKSHILFGAEYDSLLEWFIESGAKTWNEVVEDSSKWVEYIDYNFNQFVNRIFFRIIGNEEAIITQEKYNKKNYVMRGYKSSVAKRNHYIEEDFVYMFRVALWIK